MLRKSRSKENSIGKEEKITKVCLHLLLIGCIEMLIMSVVFGIVMIFSVIFS